VKLNIRGKRSEYLKNGSNMVKLASVSKRPPTGEKGSEAKKL